MSLVRVGVLMGGKSLEREVSFNSGRTICDHLDIKKYCAVPLFQDNDGSIFILPWRFLHRGKISDFYSRLASEAEKLQWKDLKSHIDILYPALHGKWAEDGSLQGLLEILKIPYVGSKVSTSAFASYKPFHDLFLSIHGIRVPLSHTVLAHDYISFDELCAKILEKISFPLIVKPANEGSSFGVNSVKNKEELMCAIKKAQSIDSRTKQDVLVQEKIEGMEFSCVALQKNDCWKALEPTEIVHHGDDYVYGYIDKYMPGSGEKHTPARCSNEARKKIKSLVEKVASILEASTIIRVDGFVLANEEIVILESNTFPGMAPTSFTFWQAACENMCPTDFINETLYSALSSYNMIPADLHNFDCSNELLIQNEKKIRVAVLLGGESNEKETSLDSGRNVVYKLSPYKYITTPLFVSQDLLLYAINNELLVKNTTQEISEKINKDTQIEWDDLSQLFDFVFIGLHGGSGENGSVQGLLESFGLPYNGSSVLSSALCMDKNKTKQILKSQGFDVPRGYFITKETYREIKRDEILFPCIVKPHDDGCSCLVNYCCNYEELEQAIKNIFDSGKNACLIEEYIQGMELTVGVLGNSDPKAFPPTYTPKKEAILSLTEKFLPGDGENITPAPLSKDDEFFVKEIIEKAYQALYCKGYARIDCFFQNAEISPTKERRLVILECNTLPALTPATCLFHQAAEVGMRPMELIDAIVQLGISREK